MLAFASLTLVLMWFLSSSAGAAESDADIRASGERVENYERDLSELIDEVSGTSSRMDGVQSDLDSVGQRIGELEERSGRLSSELELRERDRKASEESYRAGLVRAYQDGGARGLDLLLGDLLDGEEGLLDPAVRRALFEGRSDLEETIRAEESVRETIRHVEATKRAQTEALSEQRRKLDFLEAEIRDSEVAQAELRAEISTENNRVERQRSEQQEARQEKSRELAIARIDNRSAASGGASSGREREIEVAREIPTLPTEEMSSVSYSGYMKLYRESAERYGFDDDWYILAAIGEVESDHGTNLGPSSAGAMGPMQFLPSTWETSGVDGNGDGEANIMDPEDAIPAAAGYLVAGGAPEDWYAAIYSYNHADWYVQKVLAVAEGYEQLDREGRLR